MLLLIVLNRLKNTQTMLRRMFANILFHKASDLQ
jgi:hypothetical protein